MAGWIFRSSNRELGYKATESKNTRRQVPRPTVLQGGGNYLLRRRSCAGPVAGLYYQTILGELIQVVQGVHFAVPRGVDTDDIELEVAPGAVLSVAYLVATYDPIL